mgnify:CR=1 FL=1
MCVAHVLGQVQACCAHIGVATLGVDGQVQAEGQLGLTAPNLFTIDETFDVVSAAFDDAPNAVRFRRGFMLGDGTGAGKGRQSAGIILDLLDDLHAKLDGDADLRLSISWRLEKPGAAK